MADLTDRELLELAAKAAGIYWDRDLEVWYSNDQFVRSDWNPLTDDGDAQRLAVRICLTVKVAGHECEVFNDEGECLASVPIMGASCFVNLADATNPYAATRRAIVRAAAAIAGQPAQGGGA